MFADHLPLLAIGSVALLALLLGLRQLQVASQLKREVHALRSLLSAGKSEPLEEQDRSFSSSLDQVERRQAQVAAVPRANSEKYRYVASLADQGVDAEGIAAALQMAPAEVEQLMRLARLKQQVQA